MKTDFSELFEQLPDALCLLSWPGRQVAEINASARRQLGIGVCPPGSIDASDLKVRKAGLECELDAGASSEPQGIEAIGDLRLPGGELHAVEARGSLLQMSGRDWLLLVIRPPRIASEFDAATRVSEASLWRSVQRRAGLGTWEYEPETRRLHWSREVYALFGVDPQHFVPSLDSVLDLVHEEDRRLLTADQREALKGQRPFDFIHRVRTPDGRVRLVRQVAEAGRTPRGPLLAGVVQDLTPQIEHQLEAEQARELLGIASEVARLEGWHLDLARRELTWATSAGAAAAERVAGSDGLELLIAMLVPEYGPSLRAALLRCATQGQPFDELVQLREAEGGRCWARVIGHPEIDREGAIRGIRGGLQQVDDLIEARDAARVLAQRLKDTLENMGEAFCTLDAEWRFIFVNREFERLMGCSREALVGTEVWTRFPDTAGSGFERHYRAAMDSGQPQHFERDYGATGQWFAVSAYPTSEGLAVYFRDISQERMRDEHMRLVQGAMANIADLVIITEAAPLDEPHGPRIVYVNKAFEQRMGYTAEQVVGRTPRLLQGPDTQRDELDRIRTALMALRPVRAELINYTRAGEPLWLELDIAPLLDLQGHCTHFVSVERDITDRKRAEQALRASEERFKLVARATHDVIWDYDVPANRLWWNENVLAVFGYAADQLEPGLESWITRIHPDDRERVVADMQESIDGGGTSWEDEYRFLRADGSVAVVIDRGFLHRDLKGRALRMIGSMIDITERRHREERQLQSQRLEAVGQLTGGVAHDFNNLLTVIVGHCELLKEHLAQDSFASELTGNVLRAAERGAELTARLLAVARRQPLAPQRVDCAALLRGMRGLLGRTLDEDIDLQVRCAPDLWSVEVDPGQLEVALLNLALNARDAMARGGHLWIEASNVELASGDPDAEADSRPGPYVLIAVSDSGVGILPDMLGRVFEPFFTTKAMGKGSGLGLSMVYGFIRQSGGQVRIYSEPGSGTCVRLYLPRADGPAEEPRSQAPPDQEVGGSECLLVVEDDPLVRRHVMRLLQDLGYRVLSAESASPALELLEAHPDIDLLFTDVVMPGGMNGAELAREASSIRPDLKVLFTSGYTEDAIIHQGRLEPGVHLLSKPYRRQELARKLREVLACDT